MKPLVILTGRVHTVAVELLLTLCDVALLTTRTPQARREFRRVARSAHALLAATPERIDASLLGGCHALRIVACTYRIPEHIDINACTRRGIWVATALSHEQGKVAEIEAARNILDALSGDTPRGALNQILQTAA
jgi:phosphonate dehydrogenase